jgi:hypothetical protein
MLAELMGLDALDFAEILDWTKTRNTVGMDLRPGPRLIRLVDPVSCLSHSSR